MSTQTTTITPELEVDYNDPRFAKIDIDTELAVKESDKMYDERLEKGNALIQSQINASKQWADTQSTLQQEQTDFAIEQIEQQKKETEQDYLEEQSAAFVDYKKESNGYSVGAEQMAAAGLKGSGYSETVKGGMYNAYQNRIAVARAALVKAIQNFDNAITQAKLQNSAAQAEIAYNALQEQISLALAGFEFENAILDAKASAKAELYQQKEASYQDVYEQIMREKELEALYGTLDLSALKEQEQLEIDGANDVVTQFTGDTPVETVVQPTGQSTTRTTVQPVVPSAVQPLKVDVFDTSTSESTKKANTSTNTSDIAKTAATVISMLKKKASPTVDTGNVIALGYGPISEKELAKRVSSGEVSCTQIGNKLVFTKNTTATLK